MSNKTSELTRPNKQRDTDRKFVTVSPTRDLVNVTRFMTTVTRCQAPAMIVHHRHQVTDK